MTSNKTSWIATGVIWIGASIALADEPPPSTGPAAKAAQATSSAQPASSSVAPATEDAALIAEDKTLREQGYKPEMRKGVRYYCRHEAPLGSRLEQTRCMTAEQSMDKRRQSKEMTERAQRIQTNPTKG